MGPKFNMTSVLMGEEVIDRHGGEEMDTAASQGMPGLPETRRGKERSSPGGFRRSIVLQLLDFGL